MQKYLYEDLYKLEEVHWWHKAKRSLVSHFLEINVTNKKNKILDVGCGTGKNIEVFSKFGETLGIDSSQEAIFFCKKRGLENVVKGSIEHIPFDNNTFDFVTALDVLEHVDDSKSLKEIYRVLKNSGILIATVPAFPHLWSRWDEVLHHKKRYTKQNLKELLHRSKFKVFKISYMYSFLYLPVICIRTIKKMLYKKDYPSDFKLSNKYLNSFLSILANLEKNFIIRTSIYFGTSLIVISKKLTNDKKK